MVNRRGSSSMFGEDVLIREKIVFYCLTSGTEKTSSAATNLPLTTGSVNQNAAHTGL